MKLLLDNNLSWRLIRELEAVFPGSRHVEQELPGALDSDIAEYAARNDFLIVTRDRDFITIALRRSSVRVIVLNTSDGSTRHIAAMLHQASGDIRAHFGASAKVLLLTG